MVMFNRWELVCSWYWHCCTDCLQLEVPLSSSLSALQVTTFPRNPGWRHPRGRRRSGCSLQRPSGFDVLNLAVDWTSCKRSNCGMTVIMLTILPADRSRYYEAGGSIRRCNMCNINPFVTTPSATSVCACLPDTWVVKINARRNFIAGP